MGFFTDLKDDLSQAVNELMPEEELAAQGQAGEAAEGMAVSEEALASMDLSGMLDKIEEMGDLGIMPEAEPAPAEEPVVEEVLEAEPVVEEVLAADPVLDDLLAAGPTVEDAIIEEPTAEEIVIEEPVAEEPTAEAEIIEEKKEEEAESVMAEEMTAEVTAEKEQNGGGKEKTMEVQANRVAVDETAVVTEGMTITGDIISEGSMELIGTVNGNLDILGKLNITGTIQGNSKAAEIFAEGAKITGEVNSGGSVKIGQSSVVIGNITATSAVVAGAVKGDIDVQGPVILDTTAIVMGNIKSKSVQINNGAVIEGMCSQCYADVNPTSFFEEFKKKK
ncbi:MAG: polymer-forming cytoskeletal protein [Bacteroidales bacterium]|nr:polymer-forming cytoskeletal protein [Bacteroidales bacterium]MCM1415592.1 polymer-forming cytoskeletal protein [bacterium]MCM1422985.1 polymer-forming cytoskeletal protein [bacterium]